MGIFLFNRQPKLDRNFQDEIDLTSMANTRKEMAEEAKLYGVKLSYMPFFVKAASLALHQV